MVQKTYQTLFNIFHKYFFSRTDFVSPFKKNTETLTFIFCKKKINKKMHSLQNVYLFTFFGKTIPFLNKMNKIIFLLPQLVYNLFKVTKVNKMCVKFSNAFHQASPLNLKLGCISSVYRFYMQYTLKKNYLFNFYFSMWVKVGSIIDL